MTDVDDTQGRGDAAKDPVLLVTSAAIEEEHELLDGAGVIRRFEVQLSDGRVGSMVAGEEAAPKNRRRLWTELVHKGPWEAPGTRARLETKPFAAAEEPPAGKRGRRRVKRARRLAGLNQLLAQAPELFTPTCSLGGERDVWGADLTILTMDDDRERARRDRLARLWTIHEAAETHLGWLVVRATCRWPDPPLDNNPYAERPRHYVLRVGGSMIKAAGFSYPGEVKHGLDPKQLKKLRSAIMDGSINRTPPAGVPDLGSLLADVRDGFRYRDDARAVFSALAERPERLADHRNERDKGPEPVGCPLESVEIIEWRALRTERYFDGLQGGEVLLLRVMPQAPGGRPASGRRRPAQPKEQWVAVRSGKEWDIPTVRVLGYTSAAMAMVSDDVRDHLPRLIAALLADELAPSASEAGARSQYVKVVEDDDRRRLRAEELERDVELVAVVLREDGSTVVRYHTAWPAPDPVLGERARPREHLALVMADGVDVYGIGPDGAKEQAYNAQSDRPCNVAEALAQLRADPAAYGPAIEDHRWHLAWVLKSLSAGFRNAAAADAAWKELTGKEVAACAVDPAWGDLSRNRRQAPDETRG